MSRSAQEQDALEGAYQEGYDDGYAKALEEIKPLLDRAVELAKKL